MRTMTKENPPLKTEADKFEESVEQLADLIAEMQNPNGIKAL